MTPPAPASDDVLEAVDGLGPPGTPVTTPEVAEAFDCTQRTIYNRLDSLVDDGVLETKKVGANSRVWWRPVGGDPTRREASYESRAQVRSHPVFDSDLVGVIVWDDDIRISDANDAFLEMAGLDYEAALGTSWRDLTPEEFYPASERHLEQFEETGSVDPYEKQYYHADGSRWWGLFESRRLNDGGFVEFVVDITERKAAEKEHRETKGRLEVALDAAGMGTWEWDLDARTVRGDDTLMSMHDLPPTDEWVPIKRFLEKQSGPSAALTEDVMATSFEPGEEIQEELHLEECDPPCWISWRGRALEDDPSVLRGVSFDITERKEAEIEREQAMEAVRESEERYHRLFESINEGFCVIEVLFDEEGEDYRYLETNPAYEDVTGLKGVEGKRLSELSQDFEPRYSEMYRDVIETGEPARFEARGKPLTDGWYDVSIVPYGEEGSGIVAVLIDDITERKAAEEKLRESEEKYRSVFKEMNEGFALCELVRDDDGDVSDIRYVELNEAFEELTGVSRSDAKGRLASDVFSGFDEWYLETYERVVETGDPERVENYISANDRWYDVRMLPRDGDVVAILYTDITESKRREQRDQFLLDLGDQIRTLTDEEEIGERAARLLAEELGLDRAYFVRFDADAEEALVGPEYHSSTLDPVGGRYPFSALPEAIQRIQAETPIYDDVANDSTLAEAERQTLLDLGFGAWIGAPIRTDDDGVDWALYAVHSESHDWTDAEVSLVEEAADRTWTAVERARAEQALTRSNQSLERLNDASRELLEADPEAISRRVVQLVVDILAVEYAALWGYDARTGNLELDSEHAAPGTDLDAIRPANVAHEQVWEAFVGDEINAENSLDIADGEPWPSRLGSRVFVPLGRHGVICVGSVDAETFDGRLLDLLKMVVSTIETVWDRAESEAELERRNEELTQLDRLNSLIREIDQALVGADTREEIDEAVCERLADSDLYEFAWVGEHDPVTDAIEPRAWAGVDSGYIEDLAITVEDTPTDPDPIARAVRTGDLQVVADIATDSGFAPWREATLERGARSLVCIPLVYDDAAYGVLTVYADHPQSDEDERNQDVLSELGDTIAHTLNARETRATLQTDSVVELTLRFEDADTPLCRLARDTGCTIEHQGFVPQPNGNVDVFFIARGITPETLQDTVERSLAFDDLDCLTEGADGALFRARVSEPTLAARVSDEGAVVRAITIDAGVATAVLDIPHTAAVREFLNRLREWHPDFELRARQPRERPLRTRQTFVTTLEDRLTNRQREVLQTAYLSGFFEMPRVSNGQEVTDLLGVSQPTFSEHLRAAERTLCEVLFETDSYTDDVGST